MGSLCFSSASILRCDSLNRVQAVALFIPTLFQAIFSTSLILARRGTGDRQYLWLTVEGWIYFILALLEMVSHVLPGRDSAGAFKAIDTLLAVSSFLPILCYTLFILLFARAELISILPVQYRTVCKLMLPIFILLIGGFNQLASLLGISNDIVTPGQPLILIGFKDKNDETLWAFFTSLTLALLTAYQAINFSFALNRIIRVLLDKHRIKETKADQAHLFRGLGWICGGLKMGAIETVVGFAGGSFGVAFARRILRLLARAFVCVGIAKGLDLLEDFKEVRRELALSKAKQQQYRQSRIRQFISNPRLSTFHQLSPRATTFRTVPPVPSLSTRPSTLASNSQQSSSNATDFHMASPTSGDVITRPSTFASTFLQPSPTAITAPPVPGVPTRSSTLADGTPNLSRATTNSTAFVNGGGKSYQRVTMDFKNGTPVLNLRFSVLGVPDMIDNKSKHRPQSEVVMGSRATPYDHWDPIWNQVRSSHFSSLLFSKPATTGSGAERHIDRSSLYNPYDEEPERHLRSLSNGQDSVMSPLAAVRELTAQFPVVPPRAFIPPNQFMLKPGKRAVSNNGSRVVSEKPSNDSMRGNLSHATSLMSTHQSAVSTPTNVNVLSEYLHSKPTTPMSPVKTRDLDDGLLDLGMALQIGRSSEVTRTSQPAEWIDFNAIQHAGGKAGKREGQTRVLSGLPVLAQKGGKMQGHRSAAPKVGSRASKIKSIGAAPMRLTPTPTMTKFATSSWYLEAVAAPPAQAVLTKTIQERNSLDSIHGQDVLRDQEVLAIEVAADNSMQNPRRLI